MTKARTPHSTTTRRRRGPAHALTALVGLLLASGCSHAPSQQPATLRTAAGALDTHAGVVSDRGAKACPPGVDKRLSAGALPGRTQAPSREAP